MAFITKFYYHNVTYPECVQVHVREEMISTCPYGKITYTSDSLVNLSGPEPPIHMTLHSAMGGGGPLLLDVASEKKNSSYSHLFPSYPQNKRYK